MVLLVSMIMGCSTPLSFSSEQPGCTDYDFNDPAESALEVSQQNLSVHVRRTNVIEACDAVFRPDVTTEGTLVLVREFWEGGGDTGEDACETCMVPTLTFSDPPGRKFEFRWYLENADVPYSSVEFKVE